jgi:hypothetical protein
MPMYLADQRVIPQARPAAQQTAGFEVVMLGHCGGKADLSQLRADAVAEISALGLVDAATNIKRIQSGELQVADLTQGKQLQYLYDIPVPILSLADFQVLFPQARQWPANYKSQLAGEHYWLPKAVEDFFTETNPLPTGAKKLWLVRVDEAEGQSGFLPQVLCDLTDTSTLKGLHLAMLPPAAGLVAMPDLERLQIPQQLPDIPRVRLQNPAPAFLPCSEKQPAEDGHRERRYSDEMPVFSEPWETKKIVSNIIEPLHRHRPDMQCLWSLGLEYHSSRGTPSLSSAALQDVTTLRTNSLYSHGLHRIQFLFPYLRSAQQLYSASGLLAGRIASQSVQAGAWRSVAGLALPDSSLPYPAIDHREAAQLRESYGLGLFIRRGGRTYLDDERLASPYTPKFGHALGDDSAQRSGEFVRFMGFLQRQLYRLGESILFTLDPLDPRPKLLLEQFFNRLHELGALRGGVAENAYSIVQVPAGENALKYEIQIAPAFPIDRIQLSFSHQRGENSLALNWEGF